MSIMALNYFLILVSNLGNEFTRLVKLNPIKYIL